MSDVCIGVVGLGFLGRGIAACALGRGFTVVGYARNEREHAEARKAVGRCIGELVDRAGFPPALREEWSARYRPVTDWAPLADCALVIESVTEDAAVKASVFDHLEEVVGPDTVIASNTSALPIALLQNGRRRPERFVGMHWAEPAHASRFLELIRGGRTTDAAFEFVAGIARQLGKDPSLVRKDVPGFLVNRIGYAMYREALHLLETGVADAETIDRSFRNAAGLWASLCGPLRWIDLTGGPELYARAMAPVLPTLNSSTEVPAPLRRLAEEGARGIANGRGFYTYTPEEAQTWEERHREHAWKAIKLME